MLWLVAPVLQLYVVAPAAVRFNDCPTQMVLEALEETELLQLLLELAFVELPAKIPS